MHAAVPAVRCLAGTPAPDFGVRQHLLRRAAQQQGVAALHLHGLLEAEWHDRFLFHALQPMDSEEIDTTVQRAVAAFMAAYGPVHK